MSTSATLPNTIQMRPSRLTGLVVGVAILTGVATWSVSQVTTESHSSSPKSEVVSTSQAASVRSVNAHIPELQSVDISTEPYLGSLNALNPEGQARLKRAADLAAVADWARAEGLTGLSPASLNPSAGPDASIADWARAEGLTGLSPASLKPSTAPVVG